ncbi:Ig-like domain-containing protein [Fructobacillus sp. M1-13]|uniref:Uncharacterized protein n=1 Tax=Fructobacillus papyriferae TaxID=2713171 RepID=A0ABS5QR15_9LACO|nr:collagen binding domain-containing protein [Fructobacillus papyriferae]MBS9334846.1 hypothetical protein [Fructobacillus papyriferae]MCD2158836.1 Ig-like domain-containing protein [Fructobacillus papyriferae]
MLKKIMTAMAVVFLSGMMNVVGMADTTNESGPKTSEWITAIHLTDDSHPGASSYGPYDNMTIQWDYLIPKGTDLKAGDQLTVAFPDVFVAKGPTEFDIYENGDSTKAKTGVGKIDANDNKLTITWTKAAEKTVSEMDFHGYFDRQVHFNVSDKSKAQQIPIDWGVSGKVANSVPKSADIVPDTSGDGKRPLRKDGDFAGEGPGLIYWVVRVNYTEDNVQNAVIKDTLGPGETLDMSRGITVFSCKVDGDNVSQVGTISPKSLTVDKDLTSFTVDLGDISGAYNIFYYVKFDENAPKGTVYINSVVFTGNKYRETVDNVPTAAYGGHGGSNGPTDDGGKDDNGGDNTPVNPDPEPTPDNDGGKGDNGGNDTPVNPDPEPTPNNGGDTPNNDGGNGDGGNTPKNDGGNTPNNDDGKGDNGGNDTPVNPDPEPTPKPNNDGGNGDGGNTPKNDGGNTPNNDDGGKGDNGANDTPVNPDPEPTPTPTPNNDGGNGDGGNTPKNDGGNTPSNDDGGKGNNGANDTPVNPDPEPTPTPNNGGDTPKNDGGNTPNNDDGKGDNGGNDTPVNPDPEPTPKPNNDGGNGDGGDTPNNDGGNTPKNDGGNTPNNDDGGKGDNGANDTPVNPDPEPTPTPNNDGGNSDGSNTPNNNDGGRGDNGGNDTPVTPAPEPAPSNGGDNTPVDPEPEPVQPEPTPVLPNTSGGDSSDNSGSSDGNDSSNGVGYSDGKDSTNDNIVTPSNNQPTPALPTLPNTGGEGDDDASNAVLSAEPTLPALPNTGGEDDSQLLLPATAKEQKTNNVWLILPVVIIGLNFWLTKKKR